MTTVVEPTTDELEGLDFRPVCEGRSINTVGGWTPYICFSSAEIIRFKKCGCIVLQCAPCRNKIKEAIESMIAVRGYCDFFCTLCKTRHPGVQSYWDMTVREAPL